MRILAIVAPYAGTPQAIHLNARGDIVMIAPDRIVDYLLERGHQVVYCLVTGEECPRLACCSGLPLYTESDIKNWEFDLIWHCVKDPTPSQFVPEIRRITARVPRSVPIINNTEFVQHWTKPYYYAAFAAKEIRVPKILPEGTPVATAPGKPPRALRVSDRNNDRERGKELTVEFIDNVKDGSRSFFRVPYCAGKVLPGTRYIFPADAYVAKTGGAIYREPYRVPLQFAIKVATVLTECGIGIAHIEGFPRHDGGVAAVFDVNPFPLSDGATFDPMSKLIAQRLEHVYSI
jgi:hypothetical protein